MGMRFRKSIRLGKHVRLNLSKSGIGYSVGTKGFRVTKMANGRTRTTTSIPGTGISHVSETSRRQSASVSRPSSSVPKCPACGCYVYSDDLFCRKCGEHLHLADSSTAQSEREDHTAPRSAFGRLCVTLLIIALSLFVAFVIPVAFPSDPSPSADIVVSSRPSSSSGFTPSASRDTTPADPESVRYVAPTRLSIVPASRLSLTAGSVSYFTVSYDNSPNVADIRIVCDVPDALRWEVLAEGTIHVDYKIIGDIPGTYQLRAEYGDLATEWITVVVAESSAADTEDIPTSPVYWFIVNTNTKVIHRASCSRAPSGGNQTTEYAYYIGQGYKHCSYCFD